MPKANPLWFAAVCVALSTAATLADTVTLKSGDKVEGKITSESETEVVMEEKVSAGITDTRTIPRAEIAKIDKEQPDLIAWQALKNLKPGANSLPGPSYEQAIRALNSFSSQYPKSAHAADAKSAATAFEEEKKRVDGGEVKLSGNWLSKEEAQKERYQINGLIAFNHMKEQGARGDLIGALNTFDVLEKTYPGARVYPDAVELARSLMGALRTDLDRRKQTLTFQLAEREKGLQLASEPQKSELIAVHKQEEAAAQAALDAAQKQGLKWTPIIPRSQKSIEAIAGRIPNEIQRLGSVEVAKMRQSVQAVERARAAMGKQEFDAAEKSLQEASSLWSSNELAARLQAELSTARTQVAQNPPGTTPATGDAAATAGTGGETAPPVVTEQSSSAAESSVAEGEEPEKHFLLTPAGAIVVVILVVLVIAAASAYKKIKGRANDILE